MANFPKLNACVAYARAHPEEADLTAWARRTPCGTTMCLAGIAVFLAGFPFVFDRDSRDQDIALLCVVPLGHPDYDPATEGQRPIPEVARAELELTEQESDRLFHYTDTLDDIERVIAEMATRVPA